MYISLCPKSNPDYLEGNTQIIIKFNIYESFAEPNGVKYFQPARNAERLRRAVLIVYLYLPIFRKVMDVCMAAELNSIHMIFSHDVERRAVRFY